MVRKRTPGTGVIVGRVAGRTRRRAPRVRLPRIGAGWIRGAAAGFTLALLTTGGVWLYSSPLLSIQDVSVQGNTAISDELARTVADLEGRSVIFTEFGEAEERLAALPLVKAVQIERDWPNDARITITERTAWGLWQIGERRVANDDEGVVVDLPAPADAPVILQVDATALPPAPGERVDAGAVAVARQLVTTAEQTLGRSVVALEFSQASGLTAVLSDSTSGTGLRVVFGDAQGYDFKVAALFAVLQQARNEGRTLSRVDLRFGDRVTVQ